MQSVKATPFSIQHLVVAPNNKFLVVCAVGEAQLSVSTLSTPHQMKKRTPTETSLQNLRSAKHEALRRAASRRRGGMNEGVPASETQFLSKAAEVR